MLCRLDLGYLHASNDRGDKTSSILRYIERPNSMAFVHAPDMVLPTAGGREFLVESVNALMVHVDGYALNGPLG